MSAGEQRLFRILDAIFRAPKYGLILVDEIDLFLHQDAIYRMLRKLCEHCTEKSKQLIFTTHFPPVAEMCGDICIYTLNDVAGRTILWQGYSHEAIRHITGTQIRPIQCYVEDDVAEQIVGQIAASIGIRRFVEFGRCGPAGNVFGVCAGLYLSNQSTEHTLGILDGDVYGIRSERRDRVKSALTGNQPEHVTKRHELMRLVRTLTPTKDSSGQFLSPEQALHKMLHELPEADVPDGRRELHRIAQTVVNVPERHGFVNRIIELTGESREVALSKIIELASLSSRWERYTRIVRKWMLRKSTDLGLLQN
jgi:predicted ATP-dependent endonuclease of OLD family